MFGYVKTYTPELKVCEYEYYRGAYCGLCRSMGKCTGQCSRMTLSYDFAFLALIRLSLSNEKISFKRRRCIAHPLKKKSMMEENAQLDYCAYAASLLTYHKLRDDIADEKGFKRFTALLLSPSASHSRKKALKKVDEAKLDSFISEKLKELAKFEKSGVPSVDTPADIFGEILSEITSYGFGGAEERIAKDIGYHVGRWVYIADALDDFPEDIEKNRYNPFALMYGQSLSDREKSLICDALKNELCDVEMAVDLIEFKDSVLKDIIYNVFYLGMPKVIESVTFGKKKGEDENQNENQDENKN